MVHNDIYILGWFPATRNDMRLWHLTETAIERPVRGRISMGHGCIILQVSVEMVLRIEKTGISSMGIPGFENGGTYHKAYVSGLCKEIYPQNMAISIWY